MTTKHAKTIAVAPIFNEILGAGVIEYPVNTDELGMFSGDDERRGSALEVARRKCEWGLDRLDADYGIASEGRFGPHPSYSFIPCGREILYFIDRKKDFHLYLTRLCEKTNYQTQTVDSIEALAKFAAGAQFPSHALVVRPNQLKPGMTIYKGIDTRQDLERAFWLSREESPDGLAWVETDMRAHLNPTRMSDIAALSRMLAQRLATQCPACQAPGWGLINAEDGPRWQCCDQQTNMIAFGTYGCVLCDHMERKPRRVSCVSDGQTHHGRCNP